MTKSKFYKEDEVINESNIVCIAETVALSCMHFLNKKMPCRRISKMYSNLIWDTKRKNDPNYTLSNSYELVLEAALCLSENIGRRLDEITTVQFRTITKQVSILEACFKRVNRILAEDNRSILKHIPLEECELLVDFDITNRDELDAQWDTVEEKIDKLNLTEAERRTLYCYIDGKGYSETAREVHCAVSTAFDRRIKFQKRYLAVFG